MVSSCDGRPKGLGGGELAVGACRNKKDEGKMEERDGDAYIDKGRKIL